MADDDLVGLHNTGPVRHSSHQASDGWIAFVRLGIRLT